MLSVRWPKSCRRRIAIIGCRSSQSGRRSRRAPILSGRRRSAAAGGRDGRNKGAARERRRLRFDLDDADYVRDTSAYHGAQIALRIDRDVIADDGRVLLCDTRYFPTSLDPGQVSAAELLATVRAHRRIENSLIDTNDRWRDEDPHGTIRPGVAEWLTQRTTAALTILRLLGPPDFPSRGRADQFTRPRCKETRLSGLR